MDKENKSEVRESIATWYAVDKYADGGEIPIREVQVVAFTDKTVTTVSEAWNGTKRETRNNLSSDYQRYFLTRQAAKDFLIARYEREIETAASKQREAESMLAKIKVW